MRTFLNWYLYWIYRFQLAIRVPDPVDGAKWAIVFQIGITLSIVVMLYLTEFKSKIVSAGIVLVMAMLAFFISVYLQYAIYGNKESIRILLNDLELVEKKKYRFSLLYVPLGHMLFVYIYAYILDVYVLHTNIF